MRYRLVIFDYDGTLADSGQWFADNFNRFAAKHRFRQVTRDELEALRGISTREVIRTLRISPWRMPFIARDMRRAVAEPGGTPKLFAGVTELLERVERAGIRIGVVSSNTEANIRVGLGPVNAARVAAFDCGAAIFGKAKKLKRLTRRIGIEPHEVLGVGDDTRDVEAAREAGLSAAAVAWGYATETGLATARPDHLVRSVEELAGVLGV